jgi:hypothetical protein
VRTLDAIHSGEQGNPARALIGRKPDAVPDGFAIVEAPAVFRMDGQVVGAYLKLPDPSVRKIEHVLSNSRPKATMRTNGLPGLRMMFGAAPRSKLRQDYCRFTEESNKYAALMPLVSDIASDVSALYRSHLPNAYATHMEVSGKIRDEWRFAGTPFCSCNFNYNFAIPYHLDAGNQSGVFSNVLVARRGVVGGQLVLPEFGAALAMRNGDLVIFDGTRVVHGVTPIMKVASATSAYRCSIVLYSMKGMERCLSCEEERSRTALLRTVTESRWRATEES